MQKCNENFGFKLDIFGKRKNIREASTILFRKPWEADLSILIYKGRTTVSVSNILKLHITFSYTKIVPTHYISYNLNDLVLAVMSKNVKKTKNKSEKHPYKQRKN